MKKTYSKPSTAFTNMNMEAMIALSTQNGTEITNGNKGSFEMYGREEDWDWDEEQGW
ncbi:MAG: hypothetical protein UHL07_01485 [Bacteroidaceae bacterium]|nr:hypothetical protein [Bacteroidaceae bacterium]